MNDVPLSSPPGPAIAPPAARTAAGPWRPEEERRSCPLGRPARLIPLSAGSRLVECVPGCADHCPNFMTVGGGFFCRAFLDAAGNPRAPGG